MTSGTALRGSRVGAGPMGEPDVRGNAPRVWVSFWCASGHETRLPLAVEAAIPVEWTCTRCGQPAGQDKEKPPARVQTGPAKTHMDYVKERRTAADGEAILAEALARLRASRAVSLVPAQQPGDGQQQLSAGLARGDGNARGARVQGSLREPALRTGGARRSKPGSAGPDHGPAGAPPPQSPRDGNTARTSAGPPPSLSDSASPAPAAAWHRRCGYRRDSPSHKVMCLGQ